MIPLQPDREFIPAGAGLLVGASSSEPGSAGADTSAEDLLRRVRTDGRRSLDPEELRAFVAGLGVSLDTRAAAQPSVELRLRLENTREFGLVLSAGFGGPDAGLSGRGLGDRACVHAVAGLTDARDFLLQFRRTLAYRKLVAVAQRDGAPPPDDRLESVFARLLDFACRQAAGDPGVAPVLAVLELDPVHVGGEVTARAARCEIAAPVNCRLPRPIEKIDKLLHPASIGLIGVSTSGMNFGRIILRNLLGSGYPAGQLRVIRPGVAEVDGVRCIAGLRALDRKLDLLIVAVAAEAVYGIVDEIIAADSADAVMLIPGGLGETAASREPAAALAARINAAHDGRGGGPVFLGANCLGVVSHPGSYDSWFIPLERLPKPSKKSERNSVLLSQSGAFMITRISQNPWLDPRYMIAVGNQIDLTHGDLLTYFAERAEIETIGVYIEGFRDRDGLDFVRAVRRAVRNGKQIVVYKAGVTAAGADAVMGHTASIAGDPELFDSVVRHAGAIVAPDLTAFDDLLYLAGALHRKRIGGCRLGAVSGAGFEAVGIADSLEAGTSSMEMARLEPATVRRVQEILAGSRLDALVQVKNPIDINPGADDEAHLHIVEAFLQDPGVDAVVVGLDPTAPAVRALARSELRPGYDIGDPKSTVRQMPALVDGHDKPVVGIVDAGRLYDAMSAGLMDQGVCVFRNCARGTQALVRYVDARLRAQALRQQG